MAIALMVLSLISVTSIQQDAFAQKNLGMAITATADKGSDTITVIGKTMSTLTDVTFRVTSPSGNNVVAVWQVTPYDNGEFMVKFIVGPTWTEDGFYEITAMNSVVRNSLYTLNVFVEVNDGKTERFSVTDSNLEPGIFELYKGNTVTQDAGLTLDEIGYEWGSTMFEVSGITDRVSEAITLTITAPNGNVVSVDQVVATLDGEFMAEINVGGSIWKQDGLYTVTAYQNENPKYTDSQQVEIEAGVVVPEFGTIAAMILAVAIISIIAISAKSRLSIIPRY
jgi:predicted secreted protein with PEFG-CTERM motif